ncbi:MAG: DUF3307 domain-containing protein [Caulobacterales bacterium]
MPSAVTTLFLLLCALFTKHFIMDFVIQTKYQLHNKGAYGHPGGLLHAGLHALGSAPALLLFNPPLELIAAICAAELVVHYHLDWAKEQVVARHGWTARDSAFWNAFGLDQLFHALTYLVMAFGIYWYTTTV